MNTLYKDLIYLLSCAVNGITPDTAKVQAMDLERLYRLAKFHTVRGAVCIALKRAGVQDKQFDQAYKKAVRKNIYLDMERTAILSDFEQQGIWYMPLKGSVLKDLYPENGMREMADNDVLYDSTKQGEVKTIMLSRGYSAKSVGKSHHDVYMKPPMLNYELHTKLFGATSDFYAYYENLKRLMNLNEDSKYGFHFSDEDFYVYMLAHEYKHYSAGGTGLRSLLDCYVFLRNKGDTLNWEYIHEQTKQLDIAGFEREQRELAEKVFSSVTFPELTEHEQDLLDYYLTSCTYGTKTRSAENTVKKHYAKSHSKSKFSFIWARLFPDTEFMKQYYPFFYRHKLLLPVGYVWRWCKGIVTNRRKIQAEMRALRKYDNKKV
ncbi:MAG: nucleotidyltransferase family protein [Ruminococcus sp.]|nr:nucleotidyltransferase family protein [Ruminococcus sp.]